MFSFNESTYPFTAQNYVWPGLNFKIFRLDRIMFGFENPPCYEYRHLTHFMTQQTSHFHSIPPTLLSLCFNYLNISNINCWSNSLWIFLQFYTDSQFAAPHVRQLALLSRSPNQLFVYKFEQSGGPDLYANTLNITGISAWILLCWHVYIYIYIYIYILCLYVCRLRKTGVV